MSNKPTPRPRTIRCAIYTRKSTEEGLDQQYNSLDSQRDAGQTNFGTQRKGCPRVAAFLTRAVCMRF